MSFIFGRKPAIPSSATFMLTQIGRKKVQEFSGDPKSRILVALETRGTSDIDEISQASGMRRGLIERLMPSMIRAGYVQYVRRDNFEETL